VAEITTPRSTIAARARCGMCVMAITRPSFTAGGARAGRIPSPVPFIASKSMGARRRPRRSGCHDGSGEPAQPKGAAAVPGPQRPPRGAPTSVSRWRRGRGPRRVRGSSTASRRTIEVVDRKPQRLPCVGTPSGSWQAHAVAEIRSRDVQGAEPLAYARARRRARPAPGRFERARAPAGIDYRLHPLRAARGRPPATPWRSRAGQAGEPVSSTLFISR
jgi:hypothetical protein